MDQKTHDDILESVESLKSWDQSLFVDHCGKKIDISCSVGSHATSPPDAPDQPKYYYRKTCYRFDTKFCGVESWEPFKRCYPMHVLVANLHWLEVEKAPTPENNW